MKLLGLLIGVLSAASLKGESREPGLDDNFKFDPKHNVLIIIL